MTNDKTQFPLHKANMLGAATTWSENEKKSCPILPDEQAITSGLGAARLAQGSQHHLLLSATKTLRDEFAMATLTGVLAGNHQITHEDDVLNKLAKLSYGQADAMLKAREVKNDTNN